jgi:hypothetical protein
LHQVLDISPNIVISRIGKEAMSYLKHALISLTLVGALASPAFAGGDGADFMEGQMIMPSATGMVITKPIDTATREMMMKDAMPMTPGVMMMMHGGKMYTITDKKQPNGKMLSDMAMGK